MLVECRYICVTVVYLPTSRWWFQIFFIFTPKIGEDEPILTHIFQMGWFNHQLVTPFPWNIYLLVLCFFLPWKTSLGIEWIASIQHVVLAKNLDNFIEPWEKHTHTGGQQLYQPSVQPCSLADGPHHSIVSRVGRLRSTPPPNISSHHQDLINQFLGSGIPS